MMRDVSARLNDSDHTRLLKLKESEGFKDRDWGDWFRFKTVGIQLADNVDETINKNTGHMLELWMTNLAKNLTYLHAAHDKNMLRDLNTLPLQNLRDARELVPEHLRDTPMNETIPTSAAIVVGRGPSLFKHKHLPLLANTKFKTPPTVISSDGALLDCLRVGVTPDKFPLFSLSIDGHRKLIVRWYGDDNFKENNPDASATDIAANAQDVQLFNKYAPKIKVIAGSTVANNVVHRCLSAGAQVYMLHPLFDSLGYESLTRTMMYTSQTDTTPPLLSFSAAGNAGAACFVLSWNLLRCSPILLIGLDYGYLPDTPLEGTAYASKALATGDLEGASRSLIEIQNPHDGLTYKTDHVFMHYKQALFDMLDEAPPPTFLRTINATEGGIIFGHKAIEWRNFRDALKEIGGETP